MSGSIEQMPDQDSAFWPIEEALQKKPRAQRTFSVHGCPRIGGAVFVMFRAHCDCDLTTENSTLETSNNKPLGLDVILAPQSGPEGLTVFGCG
jgi:hypothetical protein